ncbi:GDP-mannose 4,6-dehydratase [Candidatus Hecatella orcuttiae]|jgi:nucleoside-diphosphate-sugar epimerase|uniref:GDP-mannose 4,6-dehydratase n=1 Tax=Candidatus Hecatella orcuttiae TaxID=1935119 RepID=UPI002868134B|nr:GDP-mannose 4,6-dehydratase [Candidatus Hecatella orcuttiae]
MILVTGGGGFIGSHAAEHYIRQQDVVVVLDNLSRNNLLVGSTGNQPYNWNYLKTNYPNIKLVKGDLADQKVYVSNISKAKAKLGWKPKVGPKEGVTRLIKWVDENKLLFKQR